MRVFKAVITVFLFFVSASCLAQDGYKRSEYIEAVVRGTGFLPWQERGPSTAEIEFRKQIEARKDRMLAERVPVKHPVMLTEAELAQARHNIESSASARKWFKKHKAIADHVVSQPDCYVEKMIPELTPWFCYGMTCPHCVGEKSQKAMGSRVISWYYKEPDVIRCRYCGYKYPDAAFPETARLVCPRSGQELTFYLNKEERSHHEDRTGRYAWKWRRRPTHVTFTGMIRYSKVNFMIRASRSLAIVYRFTDDARYAAKAIDILVRLAYCYRRWLYHDYWDAVSDCDPIYAAWHDRSLRLEWKRHLCTVAYNKDTFEKASMLRDYWGAGRLRPSCDDACQLKSLCLAYDLVHDALDPDGRTLWSPDDRIKVERDLFMEWLMGGEPFLGGAGKATNVNNKSSRVYHSMARVAKCLGITAWADTALAGFEALEAKSLAYDGFSHESPAYTFSSASYLGNMVGIAEALHCFRWPEGYSNRNGFVDLYRQSKRFRLLMHAYIDCLRPDGFIPPISDTNVKTKPNRKYLEIGLKHLPEIYSQLFATVYPKGDFSEYAMLHFDLKSIEEIRQKHHQTALPEIFFPAWMTAILRHGRGKGSSMLTMHFSPEGRHRQKDSLSIFYMAGGHTILGDHGYISDTPMNKWCQDTFSHNLVVVDGQPQNKSDPEREPKFHFMAVTPRLSVIEASSKVYDQCSEYQRLVALVKGPGSETFVVDIYRVNGGKNHAFRIFSELAASDTRKSTLTFTDIFLPSEVPLPLVGTSTNEEDLFGLRDVRKAKNPPACWQALWRQKDSAYRLWMLTQVDEVEASNGPGQESLCQPGRRVRYVDAIRKGTDLKSTFVAIHEPCRPDGSGALRQANRIIPPNNAGAEAIVLKIESEWGTYWIFSKFNREAEIDGIHFRGEFGVFCQDSDHTFWMLGVGAPTLSRSEDGFFDKTAYWRGNVVENTELEITTDSIRPTDWHKYPDSWQIYVRVSDGRYNTGFPVGMTGLNTITVKRFPLPSVDWFELPAVRYKSIK